MESVPGKGSSSCTAGVSCLLGNDNLYEQATRVVRDFLRPRVPSAAAGGVRKAGAGYVRHMHTLTSGEEVPFPEESRITYLQPAFDSRRRTGQAIEQ